MTELQRGERYGLIWALAIVLLTFVLTGSRDWGSGSRADIWAAVAIGELVAATSILSVIVLYQCSLWGARIMRRRREQ